MKKSNLAVGIVLASVIFAGCGSAASNGSKYEATTSDMAVTEEFSYDAAMGTEEVQYEADMPMNNGTNGTENSAQVQDTSRKLIKTVNMSVETRDFDTLLSLVEEKVQKLGGYIENSSIYNGSSYNSWKENRNASFIIRIPKDKLDSFVSDVKGVSNVTNCNQSVQDVTLTYVDLDSHKKALVVEQERLLELLDLAESVEDIITIESRLSQVRYEIESMESRLRSYDNQVDYSTVYMDIYEVEELTPVVEETTGERITRGFMSSIRNVGEGIKEFFVTFIIRLPYLVEWVIILGVIIWVIVVLARHSMKKGEKQTKEKAQSENNKEES